MLAVRAVITDEFLGLLPEQDRGQWVGEDERRLIDDEVRGPGGRRGERGLARQVSYLHAADNIRGY